MYNKVKTDTYFVSMLLLLVLEQSPISYTILSLKSLYFHPKKASYRVIFVIKQTHNVHLSIKSMFIKKVMIHFLDTSTFVYENNNAHYWSPAAE